MWIDELTAYRLISRDGTYADERLFEDYSDAEDAKEGEMEITEIPAYRVVSDDWASDEIFEEYDDAERELDLWRAEADFRREQEWERSTWL